MLKTLCIYHGNCADGFGAAWVVRKYFQENPDKGSVEFHPGVYQNEPPDVTGKHVLLVDFSYKCAVVERMLEVAETVTLIDHHKSAIEDLTPLKTSIVTTNGNGCGDRFGWFCDRERSGAMLAWDYFYPGKTPPKLIEHIQDRDLWLFNLEGTRDIQANVFSYPYDFEVWDKLMVEDTQKLALEGAAIERKHHKDVAELTKVVTRMMRIGGHVVPVANLPYTLTSDAGHLLAEGYPFAGCYWDVPEGRVFSLRSRDDGADVAAIAVQYGGGGHPHASGFRVPFDQLGQFDT